MSNVLASIESPFKSKFTGRFGLMLLAALAAGQFASGCASADDAEDQPLDPEFGLEFSGRADDNSVVREGSAEAEAVLRYVNQPLTNNAEGRAFLVELDSELHVNAAEGIAAFRAGPDGTFGTADDNRFDDLRTLDSVPWVGRASMLQLLVLAENAGFFAPALACETVLQRTPEPQYGVRIQDLATLVEIDNSECDHFTGSVTIEVDPIVLPVHRQLKAFDAVREIQGELRVGANQGLESLVFRNLRKVGTLRFDDRQRPGSDWSKVSFPELREVGALIVEKSAHGVQFPKLQTAASISIRLEEVGMDFPALESAGALTIHNSVAGDYPALREATTIVIRGSGEVRGFNALETVKKIETFGDGVNGFNALVTADEVLLQGPKVEGFNALQEVTTHLMLSNERGDLHVVGFDRLERGHLLEVYSPGRFDHSFAGFPSLLQADILRISGAAANFPRLLEVDEFSSRERPYTGSASALVAAGSVYAIVKGFPFPALETVGDFELHGEGPSGPSALRTVTGKFRSPTEVSEYQSLESVTGYMVLQQREGSWNGMNALETVSHSLKLDCWAGSLEGFRSLETIPAIVVDASGSCQMSAAPSLLEVEGKAQFLTRQQASFDGFGGLQSVGKDLAFGYSSPQPIGNVLPSLNAVGGTLAFNYGTQQGIANVMARLEFVGGSFLPRGEAPLEGFRRLDTIDRNIKFAVPSIGNFGAVESVGGQKIEFSQRIPVAERDAFLNGLQQFSGSITLF